MRHGCQAPEDHGYGVTQLYPESIYNAADNDHADCVGCLEGKDKVAIIDFVPSQIVLQRGFKNAEDLAIHVVLGYAQQQKSADDPAKITGARGRALGRCRPIDNFYIRQGSRP